MEEVYPSEETLKTIETWPLKTRTDYVNLAAYIVACWHWPEYADFNGKTLRLSTGGWSGNESIVAALDKNFMFRQVCWQSSKRGGHFVYKIPKF